MSAFGGKADVKAVASARLLENVHLNAEPFPLLHDSNFRAVIRYFY